MDIHVDSFLWLVRLDELLLCKLELLVVLQGQGLLEVNVRQLVLRRMVCEFEGMLEVAMLDGVVDGDFDEAVLGEQLSACLGTMLLESRVRLRQHHFFEGLLSTMHLRHTLCVLPLLQLPVHGHGTGPHLRLNVVVLCLLQIALHLILLGNVLVGVVQELLAILGDQPQHLLVLFALLVHVDRQVELVDRQVHLLGLVELHRLLQALGQRDVQLRPLCGGEMRFRHSMGFLVLSMLDVHLDRALRSAGLDKRTLCLLKLARVRVVRCELLVEGQGKRLICAHRSLVQQRLGFVPLPRSHGGVDGLCGRASLDVVVNCRIHLPLRHQPVAPFLFKRNHEARLGVLGKLNRLPIRVAAAVCVHRRLDETHALVKPSSPVVHAAGLQARYDFLEQLLGVVGIMSLDHRSSLCCHSATQVQLDRPDVVALDLLELASLLLLLRGQKPLQVKVLQVHDLGVILALGQADGLVILMELLVHGKCFVQLVVIKQDGFGALKLLGEHGHLGLRHVVVGSVTARHFSSVILNEAVHLVKVAALCDISQHGIAPLRNWQVEVLHGSVSQ
mmetsp:Transcript_53845/g.125572  ORF Transcript_53845/g.125572 Transcript_53845/m.125572 type:complete len:559 (+) Transcript_53845:1782-3458(+)